MKIAEDIAISNAFIERQCVYHLLAGINEDLNKVRRDLLNQNPLPTLDVTYATIRRELAR